MAKNKKPKKAYKPKTVFVPSIFNSMLTFEPIEQALKRIVETGTMMLDEHDIPIYMDLTGNRQSIESGLKTYKLLIKQHSTEQGHPIILRPFEELENALKNNEPLDEEVIENAIECINQCRNFVARTPAKEMLRLMSLVRKENNENKVKERQQQMSIVEIQEED